MPRAYNPVIEVDCHPEEHIIIDAVTQHMAQHNDVRNDIEGRIARIVRYCLALCRARGAYKIFNPTTCTLPPEYRVPAIKIAGTMAVLHGKGAYELLEKAKHCAFMAVTLGCNFEAYDAHSTIVRDELDEEIYEICLTTTLNHASDIVNNRIIRTALEKGYSTNDRLGLDNPDFPTRQLSDILFYTQAEERLGMSLEQDGTLSPRPSTVAIVGIYDPSRGKKRSCGLCRYREYCSIRAIGMTCHGKKRGFE